MKGGLIGVIANDSARYSLFTSCVWNLDIPDGWQKEMLIGGDWCGARNDLCHLVLDQGYSHLWFMDDDHAFPPQMLKKLLAHDKALVTPICLTRTHPFQPVQYTEKQDAEFQYLPIPLSQHETDGLVEIQAGGCAGMLIRRDVIEAIEPPWFEYTDRSEDIIFCEKAKAAGFDLWADLSVRLGHITTAVVFPAVSDGEWKTGLTIGKDLNLIVDTADVAVDKEDTKDTQWIWKLTPETDPEIIIYTCVLSPWTSLSWVPPIDCIPRGVLQWWVDEQDGNGFHPVGDPFTYALEKPSED